MEPIVIFTAGVVLYCGWLTLQDELREWRRSRFARKMKKVVASRQQRLGRFRAVAAGRANGVAAHWPMPVKGSA
jgi:hypothetical protein